MPQSPLPTDIHKSPRGARSVQRILDAAARLFGREGYRGATMQGVARAAGVSKGLLHYHFQSKEHLLIEAQRQTFRQVHKRIEARVGSGQAGMATAIEALDAIFDAVRDMRAWTPFMVETMAIASQGGDVGAPIRTRLDEFYAEAEELLIQGITRVFERDLERLAVPPDRLARLVRISLHGLIIELAYARTPADVARVDQNYRDFRDLFERIAVRQEAT
jgi:AcrR family transcriptional regulator